MKTRRKRKIAWLTLFIVGVMLVITPLITDAFYRRTVARTEEAFNENLTRIDENKLGLLKELLEKENQRLFSERQETFLTQAVSYETSPINLADYGLTENIIGFIEIPSLEVKLPIYLGASSKNMKLGAVHLTGTSYPIGGENTNSVIAAHRGYYKTLMFRQIDRLKPGDVLYIESFDEVLEYKMVEAGIIYPDEFNKLTIKEGKDMVTIFSCHPFPYGYQRYVVYFERVKESV